ncbi:MAG TPA: membrane protein insertase YidC [Jiangellaceae bacterium]|nr:membrane protein insertase YidC [Jiangellaceae bacterium]
MYSFPPLAAAIGVLYTAVSYLTTAFTPLLGAASAAAAIVALTLIVRIILLPLGLAQVRGELARLALAPKLREVRRKYGNNPARLRREIAALYQREGTSPLAGCLPALAQAPVFMVLYGLFLTTDVGGQVNVLLSSTLAGVPLGARLLDAAGTDLLVFALLFGVLIAVAAATRRLTATPPPDTPGGGLIRVLPFGTVLVAAIVPLAAGLYLLTTTAWTVTERTVLRRLLARRQRQ